MWLKHGKRGCITYRFWSIDLHKKGNSILPMWLIVTLVFAIVISGLSVSTMVYLTAEAYFDAPLNPLAQDGGSGDLDTVGVIVDEEALQVLETLPPPTPIPISDIEVTQTAEAVQATLAASSRVNVLVMGIDRRPGEPFISRTDSMMLLSINPQTGRAAIMSIPRDFYADIPGWGRDRINTAFVKGAQNGGPEGGARLAMETVSFNLGVHVDHYLLIDFAAFINGVDALGGIEVNVPFTINDPTFPDMNYGYDPLFIPAGVQTFDGVTALRYARTRHVDNDFGRAQRQQQVILAARDKVLALGADQLIRQLPVLYQQLESGIRTGMSLGQLVTLFSAAVNLPSENIETLVLDYDYFLSYTTPQGASVLVLQNDKAGPDIRALFSD